MVWHCSTKRSDRWMTKSAVSCPRRGPSSEIRRMARLPSPRQQGLRCTELKPWTHYNVTLSLDAISWWGNLLGMYFGSDLGQGELTWPENKSRRSQAEELLTTVCNTIKWGDQTQLKPRVNINPRRKGNKKIHSAPWQRGHFLHWQNSEQGLKALPRQHFQRPIW